MLNTAAPPHVLVHPHSVLGEMKASGLLRSAVHDTPIAVVYPSPAVARFQALELRHYVAGNMRVVLRNSCLPLKGTHGFELMLSDMDNVPAAISLVSVVEETKDSVVPDFDLGKHQPVPLVGLLLMVDN